MRSCFALWKRTRHILALAFDYGMKAELVVSIVNMLPFSVPGMIWHSDQGLLVVFWRKDTTPFVSALHKPLKHIVDGMVQSAFFAAD
jgi:hypothetical protein